MDLYLVVKSHVLAERASTNWFAYIWPVYSDVDRGWIVDPWSRAQETLNVVVATPVNLWLIWAIVNQSPRRYPVQLGSASAWRTPWSSTTWRDTCRATGGCARKPCPPWRCTTGRACRGSSSTPTWRTTRRARFAGDTGAPMNLVTGANGHLGANLVRRLLEDGEAVRVLLRRARRHARSTAWASSGSLATSATTAKTLAAARGCRRVYHCAAKVSTAGARSGRSSRPTWSARGTCCARRSRRRGARGRDRLVQRGRPRPDAPGRRDRPVLSVREAPALRAHQGGRARVPQGRRRGARRGHRDVVRHPRAERLPAVAHGAAAGRLRPRPAARVHPGRLRVRRRARHRRRPRLAMEKGRTGQKYIISTEFITVDELMDIFEEVTGRPGRACACRRALMPGIAHVTRWRSAWSPRPAALHAGRGADPRMQRRADTGKAQTELGYRPTSIRRAIDERTPSSSTRAASRRSRRRVPPDAIPASERAAAAATRAPPVLRGGLPFLGQAVAFRRDPVACSAGAGSPRRRLFVPAGGHRLTALTGPPQGRVLPGPEDQLSARAAYRFMVRSSARASSTT